MQACCGCSLSCAEFMAMTMNENKLRTFIVAHNLVPMERKCPTCESVLKVKEDFRVEEYNAFRCQKTFYSGKKKRQCNFKLSILDGTFFSNASLPKSKILQFVYHFLTRQSPRQEFIIEDLEMNANTVVDWTSFCREVLTEWVFQRSKPLGGPGVVVEIDEAKFGKRKYNRGRRIEGQWIFGAIERENPGNCWYVAVPDCSKDTFIAIIKEWILPGSTIMSDCWRSYNCMKDEGFQHLTVNHSMTFIDPDTGAHTQNIKRSWRDMYDIIPRYGRTEEHFEGYLSEYCFKKHYQQYRPRIHAFFEACAAVYTSEPV